MPTLNARPSDRVSLAGSKAQAGATTRHINVKRARRKQCELCISDLLHRTIRSYLDSRSDLSPGCCHAPLRITPEWILKSIRVTKCHNLCEYSAAAFVQCIS